MCLAYKTKYITNCQLFWKFLFYKYLTNFFSTIGNWVTPLKMMTFLSKVNQWKHLLHWKEKKNMFHVFSFPNIFNIKNIWMHCFSMFFLLFLKKRVSTVCPLLPPLSQIYITDESWSGLLMLPRPKIGHCWSTSWKEQRARMFKPETLWLIS